MAKKSQFIWHTLSGIPFKFRLSKLAEILTGCDWSAVANLRLVWFHVKQWCYESYFSESLQELRQKLIRWNEKQKNRDFINSILLKYYATIKCFFFFTMLSFFVIFNIETSLYRKALLNFNLNCFTFSIIIRLLYFYVQFFYVLRYFLICF